MYKLYAQKRAGSYEKIEQSAKLKEIKKTAEELDAKEYYSYMIIENNGNGDVMIETQKLYEEIPVEYGEVKSNVEVRAVNFRAKNKEQLRKITRDYIDR